MLDWLPEVFPINPWTCNTYEELYRVFCDDIRDASLRYRGNRVWFFPDKEEGKELIFWHLTTRKQQTSPVPRRKLKFKRNGTLRDQSAQRLPDLRRCERLPWINPLIRHTGNMDVLAWNYKEGSGDIKTYLWIKQEAFVVVMKRYRDMSRRLITSFYVDKDYTRKDFERKYANHIKEKGTL